MTIKQKLKEIEKFLKNQGFKICIDTSINEDNLQEYELEKIKGNYGGEAKIDFSKGYLPYCCGILEIGDLEINEYYKDEKSSNKIFTNVLVQYAFLDQLDLHTQCISTKTRIRKGKAIIFCGNQEYCSLEAILALTKLPEFFKKVNVFRNTSGNILTTFISK
jgi:hypothetical protein